MGKETVNQVQEAQRVLGRINPRRNTPRHTIIKMTETKDRDKILGSNKAKRQARELPSGYQLTSQHKL